jgi:hypothetical protein
LVSDLPSKAYAPRGVGLHPHEVLGAPEGVERDGEPRGGHPEDVVRVQRAARVLHDVAHDLRDPEGVEEQQDVLEQAVQPVHDQDAAQQEAVCRRGENGAFRTGHIEEEIGVCGKPGTLRKMESLRLWLTLRQSEVAS